MYVYIYIYIYIYIYVRNKWKMEKINTYNRFNGNI